MSGEKVIEKHSESLPVRKMHPNATLPTRAHEDDAGLDLYAFEDFTIPSGKGLMVRSGVAMAITKGYVGLVADRSSMAKKGIKTAGGVIDAGYRGEIHVIFWNMSEQDYTVKQGERIAQILIMPIATPKVREVAELDETARGEKGFGSTGR
jgi:dUTP pyrophosphatase